MPLTPAKAAHIRKNYKQIFLGRTQLINLTCRNADGTTRLVQVHGIFKPVQDLDPSVDWSGETDPLNSSDAVMQLLTDDIDLPTLRSAIYVELDQDLGVEPASRYLVSTIQPKGMLPGATRLVVALDRQR